MSTPDIAFERGLPASIDAERSILGAILLDNHAFDEAERVTYNDFAIDSHRRIFARMAALMADGHAIDIVTLSEELHKHHEVEAIGGIAYLASLTEGLPRRLSIDEYVRIVKEKAQLRALINVCSSSITMAADQTVSVDELLTETDMRLMAISAEDSGSNETLALASEREFAVLMEQKDAPQKYIGIPTGLLDLDKAIGGWVEGELAVIAARPGQGKTSLLAQSLIECGLNDVPAHCFPFEMTMGQMLRRLWAGVAELEFGYLRHPHYLQERPYDFEKLKEAVARVARFPLIIEDNPNLTVGQVVSRARISKRRHKTRFVGIDYLQKMHFSSKPEHRHIEVSDAAVKLANLAKTEHLAVIALSSLTEKTGKAANNMPVLGDLRQSGDIQYEASTVVFIHREIDPETHRVNDTGLHVIAKQRNGETGKIDVHYNKRLLFESVSKTTTPMQEELELTQQPSYYDRG